MNIASRQRRTNGPNIVHRISSAGPRIISRVFFIAKLVAAAYAFYLLSSAVTEFRIISSKLDNIESMSRDIKHLSSRLSSIDKTNAGIRRMEKYMRYMPLMADTGKKALDQSMAMNMKIDLTNSRLIGANACMMNTADRLMDVSGGLGNINGEMRHMRLSVEHMSAGFPELSGMQALLKQTNRSLGETSTSMQDVRVGIDNVGDGLDEMRELLKGMSVQFAILPEMKQSLDRTNGQLSAAFTAIEPISQEIPKFAASLQEMNETSRQMNQTTQEMAASLKRTHRQGVLGMAVLTAAGLVR